MPCFEVFTDILVWFPTEVHWKLGNTVDQEIFMFKTIHVNNFRIDKFFALINFRGSVDLLNFPA